jgi:hypothetical protein
MDDKEVLYLILRELTEMIKILNDKVQKLEDWRYNEE